MNLLDQASEAQTIINLIALLACAFLIALTATK